MNKNNLTEKEIREIEKQLSCPSGTNGIAVGQRMNHSNIEMTKSSIQQLELEANQMILELGHGNCGHLDLIFLEATNIKYFGLEVSETMWKEAQKLHSNTSAEFKLYDGQKIPFPDNFFHRIMTVNTIYFWENPSLLIAEIERILQPNGIFILTYADKSFMKDLPFVGEKFKLFGKDDITNLVSPSNLSIIDFQEKSDEVESKIGDKVQRKYFVVTIKK
jgi:SAM-dependent methyltransferase